MPSSLSDTRAAVLARMVNSASPQKFGRTQVMKLFYFLQELKGAPLGYDFRLFTYGPFDSEVLGDLATACNLGTVVEQTVIYQRGYGYDIKPGQHAHRLSNELEQANPSLASQVDEIVREFAALGAAELELRSTILFVDREWNQAGTSATHQDLADRVRQIKPHFTPIMILDRIAQMKGKGWLTSLQGDMAAPIPL